MEREADENLGRLIKNYYLEAAEARSTRETVWNDSYKRSDPSYVDKTKVAGPFYVKVPYTYRTVEIETGQLMAATEANGRYVTVRGTTKENGSVGRIVGQLLENQFRRKTADLNTSNEMVLERGAQMGLRYGNTAFLVEWDEKNRNCRLKAMDPFDYFPDWKHGRWYILRRIVTLGEFRTMAMALSAPEYEDRPDPLTGEMVPVQVGERDKGRARKAFEKIRTGIESGERTGYLYESIYAEQANSRQSTTGRVSSDDEGLTDAYVSAKDDPFNARIVILEYHETQDDGIIAGVVPNWGGVQEDLVFRSEVSPYGCCTMAPFIPRMVDNEQFGYGSPEVVGHTAEAMDVFFRAQLRYVARVADPAVLYNRHLKLRKEYLRSQSGISIPVNDTVSDIRYMETPSNPYMHQAGFSFARQMADLGTGGSEQRRGNVGGASSATEAAIAENAGSMTDRLIFRRWRRTIEQIGYVMLQVLKVHITSDEMIPVLGRDSDAFLRLKPEYLKGTFEIRFGGTVTGANPAARQANLRGIASTYGPMGVLDLAEIARADIEETGYPDPDRFLAMKAAPEPMSPRHENAALFDYAQDIEVSPRDDHRQHIASHFREYLKRASEVHPAAPDMMDHIKIHLLLDQQMMQARQGMGMPEGPRPMQPADAMMPGQPAVMNERTSTLNAERQASNNAAPNGSPGPVTAGRPVGSLARGPR